MKPFTFTHATEMADAVAAASAGARYYAGGTNLLDLMKNGVEAPDSLVDIGRLTHLAEHGPAAGIHVLWVAPEAWPVTI